LTRWRATECVSVIIDRGQQGVIYEGRWKLLIEPGWYGNTHAALGIAYELYDLHKDPAETQNLAKEYPDMVKKLTAESDDWQQHSEIMGYSEVLEPKRSFSQ
jgi:hypothetical protein